MARVSHGRKVALRGMVKVDFLPLKAHAQPRGRDDDPSLMGGFFKQEKEKTSSIPCWLEGD
jgi:hypothetical protein